MPINIFNTSPNATSQLCIFLYTLPCSWFCMCWLLDALSFTCKFLRRRKMFRAGTLPSATPGVSPRKLVQDGDKLEQTDISACHRRHNQLAMPFLVFGLSVASLGSLGSDRSACLRHYTVLRGLVSMVLSLQPSAPWSPYVHMLCCCAFHAIWQIVYCFLPHNNVTRRT